MRLRSKLAEITRPAIGVCKDDATTLTGLEGNLIV